jgi:hypothetical protein
LRRAIFWAATARSRLWAAAWDALIPWWSREAPKFSQSHAHIWRGMPRNFPLLHVLLLWSGTYSLISLTTQCCIAMPSRCNHGPSVVAYLLRLLEP